MDTDSLPPVPPVPPAPPLASVKVRRVLRVVLAVETAASAGLALWHNTWEYAVVCLLLMVGLPLLWLACYCLVLKLRAAEVRVCAVGEALLAIQIGLWAYVVYFHAGDGLGLGLLLMAVGEFGQFTWLFLMLILQSSVGWRHHVPSRQRALRVARGACARAAGEPPRSQYHEDG